MRNKDGITYESHRLYELSPRGKAIRSAGRKRRRSSEIARATERRNAQKSRDRHPERMRAYAEIRIALRKGILTRPSKCVECGIDDPKGQDGRTGIHAHHHLGYDFPLDIKWMCLFCHAKEHRARSEGGAK